VACCCKLSAVGPINEDCSHTLPRVRRSWNTKGRDYSQYFNMLAERILMIFVLKILHKLNPNSCIRVESIIAITFLIIS
jgi:hypothetical protein